MDYDALRQHEDHVDPIPSPMVETLSRYMETQHALEEHRAERFVQLIDEGVSSTKAWQVIKVEQAEMIETLLGIRRTLLADAAKLTDKQLRSLIISRIL